MKIYSGKTHKKKLGKGSAGDLEGVRGVGFPVHSKIFI